MAANKHINILLSSVHSMQVSLRSIKNGTAGLNKHRQFLLSKVPDSNTWCRFPKDSITVKDIAYLSAKTDHEFALLRGKNRIFYSTV